MIQRIAFVLIVLLVAGSVAAETSFYKKFKDDYAILDQDLMNNDGETGTVTNFVYQKDVATFTFAQGEMFLLRYVDGRPTTAIFIGKGHAQVDVPPHVERQSLRYASGDSTVNEDFEICFLRIGDNFDLQLRQATTLHHKLLGWKDFNLAKKAQGEIFFRPVIAHTFDNYFELLRSCYERKEDGFFFADFNRYTYMFDPNRPEQVIVGYEKEGGDQVITEASVFQRKELNRYDDSVMSQINYPTTILTQAGKLFLGGSEGNTIDSARADVTVRIDRDSAKYMTMFLHYNLALDSVAVNGATVDFHRRRQFSVFGVVMPQYVKKGDSVVVSLWYSGKNYVSPLPWVENPEAAVHKVAFIVPGDFTYVMPGMSAPEAYGRGKRMIRVEPQEPYSLFRFQSYASMYQPVAETSGTGLPVTFLKSPQLTKGKVECFVPDEIYQPAVLGAMNFFSGRVVGNPPYAFDFTVFPLGDMTVPGLIELPQVECLVDGTGGIALSAGRQVARQWFGMAMRPATDREEWLAYGLPEYMALMNVQNAMPPGQVFYAELIYRGDTMKTVVDRNRDQPLATGERMPESVRAYKGAWVIHMLRQMMTDLDKGSERGFLRFVQEVSSLANTRTFTNNDIKRVAEKYYGSSLDWFFSQWVYGIGLPEYTVKYSIVPKENQWVIDVAVTTDKVDANYQMPVTMRVSYEGGPDTFARQIVRGNQTTFQLGPFAAKPKELTFNEFVSVLAKEKTDKQKT